MLRRPNSDMLPVISDILFVIIMMLRDSDMLVIVTGYVIVMLPVVMVMDIAESDSASGSLSDMSR